MSLAIWRLAWRALQLGRGYSENSALESAQEQPSHTVDQRKWTVTAAGLAAEFDNDNSLTDAWALFPSRAALRHATWLESLAFTHRRMSSSRSILVRMLETASSSDEARMSNECLRITGISERLGRTATRQARPTCTAFILYPRYSVWVLWHLRGDVKKATPVSKSCLHKEDYRLAWANGGARTPRKTE